VIDFLRTALARLANIALVIIALLLLIAMLTPKNDRDCIFYQQWVSDGVPVSILQTTVGNAPAPSIHINVDDAELRKVKICTN
jgi:hypothetical protein